MTCAGFAVQKLYQSGHWVVLLHQASKVTDSLDSFMKGYGIDLRDIKCISHKTGIILRHDCRTGLDMNMVYSPHEGSDDPDQLLARFPIR